VFILILFYLFFFWFFSFLFYVETTHIFEDFKMKKSISCFIFLFFLVFALTFAPDNVTGVEGKRRWKRKSKQSERLRTVPCRLFFCSGFTFVVF